MSELLDLFNETVLVGLGISPRTWVVDDSETRRTILVDWLTERGFRVEGLGDGQTALTRLYRTPVLDLPELVLADVRMPHLGGIELARGIGQDPRFAALSIILFSGDPSRSVAETLAEADPDLATALASIGEVVGLLDLPAAIARRVRRPAS